jgi:TolB-like protein/Tfp pilus assembly protein PilF
VLRRAALRFAKSRFRWWAKRLTSDEFGAPRPSDQERLDSWKEIAAYLKRGVTTVQRWERTEGLPVRRLPHSKAGSVYAFRRELDEWWALRSAKLEALDPAVDTAAEAAAAATPAPPPARRSAAPGLIAAAVLAVAAAGYLLSSRNSEPKRGRAMLAVLPFQDLGAGAEDEYLAEGVTEEIITALARLNPERLAVIARSSVDPYRRQPKPIADVARELRVDYVLQGSVRQAGGRLRITAQLIEAVNQTHLWAEVYERDLGDVLRTEAEIAAAVGQRLSLQLLPRGATTPKPPGREAHVAYLKALHFWNKRDEASLKRGIELFRDALDLEPGYAQAHAGLASSYALLATSADAFAAPDARRLAEAEAKRALALDPNLAEGHAALSLVLCRFDWAWDECEAALTKALALDPNYATGHLWLGEHLTQRGRFEEADKALARARDLDPISAINHTHLGINDMYARRYDDALRHYASALEIDPRFLLAHRVKGLTLVRVGRVEEGLASLRHARSLNPTSAHAAADLGYALSRAGKPDEARAVLKELEQLARQRSVSAYDFAVVHAGLGDAKRALDALERAFGERATGVRWLKVEPIFDELRGDLRFKALLMKVELPG